MAASPDFATASAPHIVEARKLLRHAVRFLHPFPRVEITAPANVEAVVTEEAAGRMLRLHLPAYQAPPQTTSAEDRPYILPAMIEDPAMFRVAIELAHAPKPSAGRLLSLVVQGGLPRQALRIGLLGAEIGLLIPRDLAKSCAMNPRLPGWMRGKPINRDPVPRSGTTGWRRPGREGRRPRRPSRRARRPAP